MPWGGEVVRSALATVARCRAQNWRNAPTRAGFTQRPLLAAPSPVPPDGGQPGPRRSECPALAPLARSPAPRRARLTARACAFPPPRLPLSACRRFACCRACRRSGGWSAPLRACGAPFRVHASAWPLGRVRPAITPRTAARIRSVNAAAHAPAAHRPASLRRAAPCAGGCGCAAPNPRTRGARLRVWSGQLVLSGHRFRVREAARHLCGLSHHAGLAAQGRALRSSGRRAALTLTAPPALPLRFPPALEQLRPHRACRPGQLSSGRPSVVGLPAACRPPRGALHSAPAALRSASRLPPLPRCIPQPPHAARAPCAAALRARRRPLRWPLLPPRFASALRFTPPLVFWPRPVPCWPAATASPVGSLRSPATASAAAGVPPSALLSARRWRASCHHSRPLDIGAR